MRDHGIGSALFDSNNDYKLNISTVIAGAKVIEYRANTQTFKIKSVKAPWLIHPEARCKPIWNFVLVVLLVYTFTLMPFIVAFEEAPMFSTWWIMDSVVDGLFFCDIVIILNSALVEGETLITNRKEIF